MKILLTILALLFSSNGLAEIKLLTGCKDFPEVPKIIEAEQDYADAESKLTVEKEASVKYSATCKQYLTSAGQGQTLLTQITSKRDEIVNARNSAKASVNKARTGFQPTFKNIQGLGGEQCMLSIKEAYQRLGNELARLETPPQCR